MEQIVIKSLPEWEALAEHLIKQLARREERLTKAVVLALSGDLGAGKTTLVQALARGLGVAETVVSPTFTIMKFYATKNVEFRQLVHMDAYRVEALGELAPLHFSEILNQPSTLFCIEWGERIKPALPGGTIFLNINHEQDDLRIVTVTEG